MGNVIDNFEFHHQSNYLRGDNIVTEPHFFDVTVIAVYQKRSYRWTYDSYEGHTQILLKLTNEADIKTEITGPAATITETLSLAGRVEIDPNRLSQVRPRFPDIVQSIYVALVVMAKARECMLTVQSNDSLQNYAVNAPISGLIIKRNVQVGEATSEEPLFTIVDLSHVWVELEIFAKDVALVKQGQTITLATFGDFTSDGVIDWLAPLSSHASQSIHAQVPMDNSDGKLRPWQFVRTEVDIA